MRIIEIAALPSGGHRNQSGTLTVLPAGWAIIPEELTLPAAFPFVSLEIGEREYPGGAGEEPVTLPTVLAMTTGDLPTDAPGV